MNLNDIGSSPLATFNKVNKHLSEEYGIVLNSDTSSSDIIAIAETITKEITNLKMLGEDAKTSPEISKRLLILEGLQALDTLNAPEDTGMVSGDYQGVIDGLANFVFDHFRVSGTNDEDYQFSLEIAMDEYRSSEYHFDDGLVRAEVDSLARSLIKGAPSVSEPVEVEAGVDNSMQMAPVDDTLDAIASDIASTDDDVFGDLDTTDTASVLDKALSKSPAFESNDRAQKAINARQDNEDTENTDEDKEMIKESLVKDLRKMLESKVSQAEVMIAAKGFSGELQEMIEKIGRLQNEDLPPVTDQMRQTYGTESASAFQTQIYGAFQGVMDALYTAKSQVDEAVESLASTGRVTAMNDMDASLTGNYIESPLDDEFVDDEQVDVDLDNIDEFGGAEQDAPLGREEKEGMMESLKAQVAKMESLVERARHIKGSK